MDEFGSEDVCAGLECEPLHLNDRPARIGFVGIVRHIAMVYRLDVADVGITASMDAIAQVEAEAIAISPLLACEGVSRGVLQAT